MQSAQARRAEIARQLARHHFEIEPELQLVVYLDIEPDDTLTLLEVTGSTPASGSIEPFVFARTKDIPYVTRIAEVTPEEYEQFKLDSSRLPKGWDLSKGTSISREAP